MINQIKSFMRKYFPDILILLGIFIFSCNYLHIPVSSNRFKGLEGYATNYQNNYKILGIMLVSFGVVWMVRRYFIKK